MPDATPTTRLYLVRHGATPLTAEDRFSGAVGVDLSDEGRWQAERLGERLRDEGLTAVYASPLSRTVETAERVARAGLPTVLVQEGGYLCEALPRNLAAFLGAFEGARR